MSSAILAITVSFRVVNALLIKTFFQPDEYWQSLEPAHVLRYGYGYLTWEWSEKIRSSVHPMIFYLVYSTADWTGIDVVVLPKIFMAIVAALGDFYYVKLSEKLIPSTKNWALAITLLSAYNWYCSTRTFSNSLEMVLTTVALFYWPLARNHFTLYSYSLSLAVAAFSCIIRPTNILIWAILGVRLIYQRPKLSTLTLPVLIGSVFLGINVLLDFWFYGELCFPVLKFIKFNVVDSLSEFYGTSHILYYLVEGMPLLLVAYLPMTVIELYRRKSQPLVILVVVVVFVYSLLRHKEARFIYPLIPILHITFTQSLFRVSKHQRLRVLSLMGTINMAVALYFSSFHQRGVVDVVSYLRENSSVTSVGVLMPCHSTPWQSHLHREDVDAWFLTCNPPLGDTVDKDHYLDEADQFYENPLEFMDKHIGKDLSEASHYIFFGNLLPTMKEFLGGQYTEVSGSYFEL